MSLGSSEFAKWRCLVALVHADGRVDAAERNMLELQFRGLTFSAEQMEQINQDMSDPQDVKGLYSEISDQEDREDLVRLAYTLFWSDSDFDEAEREIYKYLKDNVDLA